MDTPPDLTRDETPATDLAPLAQRIGAVSERWRQSLAVRWGAPRVPATIPGPLNGAIEAIYEGYALHEDASRVLASSASHNLRLLIGDWCYAAGLCDVAATGNLDAVETLADLIADTAALAAEGPRAAGAPDPRDIRWETALQSLASLTGGTTPLHD
jgi:hypothetical protein